MSDHERIWLQPECCACPTDGRLWCQDPDPVDCEDGVPWTEYIRADIAEKREAELVEFAKGVVNDCLLRALSGSDENLRTPDGCIRWGRVEREIGEGIEAFSKALDKHEKEQGDD